MSDLAARHGGFYCCENVSDCGLRFPVMPGDKFRGVCPRCGSDVHMVSQVEASPTRIVHSNWVSHPKSRISLLIDNWRSLFNVGAAFRTADGAGLQQLFLCGITATPATQPKLAKTALGAELSVPWCYHVDSVKLATQLRQQGSELWVLERTTAATHLFDITQVPPASVILAAGNEVAGVDPELLTLADKTIQLPMMGSKDSLNVAVALSIAAYWLRGREMALLQTPTKQ
jgi:23S rRNA (guanosine2251-2'-O)-methyltransferase